MFLALLVFIVVAGAIVGGYYAYTTMPDRLANQRLQERLQGLSTSPKSGADDSVLAREKEGPLPMVDRLVTASGGGGLWLNRLIQQSGVHTTASAVVIMTIVLAGGAAPVAHPLVGPAPGLAGAAAVFGPPAGFFLVEPR